MQKYAWRQWLTIRVQNIKENPKYQDSQNQQVMLGIHPLSTKVLMSVVSVLGPFSFEEARQGFHQLWCEMWELDPQTDLRESDSAFFRSQYFQRSDGRLGLDDQLLDRHGCPGHVHRGA